jgi:hypothetical protein
VGQGAPPAEPQSYTPGCVARFFERLKSAAKIAMLRIEVCNLRRKDKMVWNV